jgi:hypothetical protein
MKTDCDFFFFTTASVGGVVGSSFLSMHYFTRNAEEPSLPRRHLCFCPWQFCFGIDMPFASTNLALLELRKIGIFGQMR